MTFEGLRLKIRNAYIKQTANQRRKKINKKDFTIISNNCWGGVVYESYNLEKSSPTVGMYFAPQEYLKFVSKLEYYIKDCSLVFINPNDAIHKELYKQDSTFGEYPIARIGDVEIALLHYRNEEEAATKWNRRCSRICWDNLLVKMNDQNGCSISDMEKFLEIPIICKKRIFFTAHIAWKKHHPEIIYIPQVKKTSVYASLEPFGASKKCNVNELINQL